MPEPLAVLRISPVRRFAGLVMLALLAGLMLYVAALRPPDMLGWRVFLLALGGAVLALTEAMRRATLGSLCLTRAGLFDGEGRQLAALDDIRAISRGLFAIKPSNGFTLLLSSPGPRAWAPGLWWRLGRRLGVGGVTSAAQARAMAEILSALLAERDARRDNDRG
ncbi:hypothetical protein EV663_101167 [Rhodovulum bhavnagarense]|uniref:PH (Pleckstrin Homology) domain-containing protein n=1 Tax=Rhodovulum bhavnagarense TaxID=992286 RepID=A0A4R2RL18_9RHOB|nr:hypothetical protein [Rhodovulum bhavnagarense]TCP62907.1 hypothetical protein EV663_101167 [Rhodovulum bhavnagarense]